MVKFLLSGSLVHNGNENARVERKKWFKIYFAPKSLWLSVRKFISGTEIWDSCMLYMCLLVSDLCAVIVCHLLFIRKKEIAYVNCDEEKMTWSRERTKTHILWRTIKFTIPIRLAPFVITLCRNRIRVNRTKFTMCKYVEQ